MGELRASLLRCRRRGGVLPAALESVAVAVHLQDVDVVGQAVQQCAGETLRPEDFRPLVEGQVGGDQDGAPLVALAEDLEEEFRAGGGQGHEAQLVDDQQPEAGQLPLEVEQSAVVSCQLLRLQPRQPVMPLHVHQFGNSSRGRIYPRPNSRLMPEVSRHPTFEGYPHATPVLLAFKPLDKRSNDFRWKVALMSSPHNEVCQALGK